MRDQRFKAILETPDYSISSYVCAPIGILKGEIIDSKGKKYPLPPQFIPTDFDIVLKNVGTKHLENSEFLLVFSKDTSTKLEADNADLVLSKVVASVSSPLNVADFEATIQRNQMRVVAKRLNPNDFIYIEGITSHPPSIEVFSRSVGLTTNETRGAARCNLWSTNLGKVFVFFQQAGHNSKAE